MTLSKKKAVMLLFIKCVDPTGKPNLSRRQIVSLTKPSGTYWFLTKIIDVSLGNPNIQAMHQNSMPPPSAAIRKHLSAIRKLDGPFSGWYVIVPSQSMLSRIFMVLVLMKTLSRKVHALHHGNSSPTANDGELRVVLKPKIVEARALVAGAGTLGYSDEKCMEPWRVCFERMVEV